MISEQTILVSCNYYIHSGKVRTLKIIMTLKDKYNPKHIHKSFGHLHKGQTICRCLSQVYILCVVGRDGTGNWAQLLLHARQAFHHQATPQLYKSTILKLSSTTFQSTLLLFIQTRKFFKDRAPSTTISWFYHVANSFWLETISILAVQVIAPEVLSSSNKLWMIS